MVDVNRKVPFRFVMGERQPDRLVPDDHAIRALEPNEAEVNRETAHAVVAVCHPDEGVVTILAGSREGPVVRRDLAIVREIDVTVPSRLRRFSLSSSCASSASSASSARASPVFLEFGNSVRCCSNAVSASVMPRWSRRNRMSSSSFSRLGSEGAGAVQRRFPLAVVEFRLGVPRLVEKPLALVRPGRCLVSVAFGEVLGHCGDQGVPGCCGQRRRLAQDPSLRFGVELVQAAWQVAHDGPVDRVHRQILPLRELGVVRERERLAARLQGGATLTVAKLRRRRLVLVEREGGLPVRSHLESARVHGCSELPRSAAFYFRSSCHGSARQWMLSGHRYDSPSNDASSAWAADKLIPPRYVPEFVSLYDKALVYAFASKVGVHPGIVVGRPQHDRLIPFGRMNDLKATFKFVEASGA